jgi:hypothetical protein
MTKKFKEYLESWTGEANKLEGKKPGWGDLADKLRSKKAKVSTDPKTQLPKTVIDHKDEHPAAMPEKHPKVPKAVVKEETELAEAKTVVGSKSFDNGDRYEMHVHAKGEKHEWASIIKTHQKGESLKNEHGGYTPYKTGKTDYINRHFKNLKEDTSKARQTLSDYIKKQQESNKPLPSIPSPAERRKQLGLPDPLKKEELEILRSGLDEAFTVSAFKSTPSETSETIKQKIKAAGGKIIHHARAIVDHPVFGHRENHTIYTSENGKKRVHYITNVNDTEQDVKYKKIGAVSTHQVRSAGKYDKPKNPNGGILNEENDAYTLGYGHFHRDLYKKPHPLNPHKQGTNDHKKWQDEYDLGKRDRRDEMREEINTDKLVKEGLEESTSFVVDSKTKQKIGEINKHKHGYSILHYKSDDGWRMYDGHSNEAKLDALAAMHELHNEHSKTQVPNGRFKIQEEIDTDERLPIGFKFKHDKPKDKGDERLPIGTKTSDLKNKEIMRKGLDESTPNYTEHEEINSTSGNYLGSILRHDNGSYGFYHHRKSYMEFGHTNRDSAFRAFKEYHGVRKTNENFIRYDDHSINWLDDNNENVKKIKSGQLVRATAHTKSAKIMGYTTPETLKRGKTSSGNKLTAGHNDSNPIKEETLSESKMSQLYTDIGDHLDKHIDKYKNRTMDADTLGMHCIKAHKAIAKKHNLEHKHAVKFVNDYVEGRLLDHE